MKRYVVLFVTLLSLSAAAQQPASPKPAPAPKVPQAPAVPASPPWPAPAMPAPHADPEQRGQPINIRVDVSVIDQLPDGVAQPKTVMMVLRDWTNARSRAAFEDRYINVDARPMVSDGRIRLDLTIQSEAAVGNANTLTWRYGFSLMVDNGKPMIALETADAVTKRKVSIEVKATILK